MLCTQPTHRGLARGLGAFRSDTPARPPAPVTGRRWQTGWWRQSLHALWPRPRPPRILTAASQNSLYRTGGRRRCTADNLNAAELGATGAEAHCVRRVRAASGRRPATKWGARGAGCGQAARARSLRGPKNHGGATEGAAACAGRSPRTPRLASATRTCMGVGSGGVGVMCLPLRDAGRASTGHAREARCAVDRGG